MSCHGANALNPVCQLKQAATTATTDAFTNIAAWFGQAAADATTWLWKEIGSATSINLDSPQLAADLQVTAAIAAVLCLGLFLIQVITATLRREPGALGRAAKGLIVALVASVFALAVTKVLLGAVDALSEGVVAYTMNTNMEGLGRQFALVDLASNGIANPVILILFSVVVLAAVVVIWAAMMIRKMMILIAAVLTPLAFSGATADITRSWVRRWVEFMAAMIASKLLLVIIMMVGVSVVQGAGQAGAGVGQTATQLGTGALILLMGGFAPWVAIKMFHFTGDALNSAHAYAAQAPAGARSLVSAPQKMQALHAHASTTLSHHGSPGQSRTSTGNQPGTGQAGGQPEAAEALSRDSAQALFPQPNPAGQGQSTGTGIGTAATGATGGGHGGAVASQTLPGGSSPQPASGSATADTGLPAGTAAGGAAGDGAAGSAAGGGAFGGPAAGSGTTAAPVAAPVAAAAITVGAANRAGQATGQATQDATPALAPALAPEPTPAPTPASGATRPLPPSGRTPTKPT